MQADLGEVQRTLFFPLVARARETVRRKPTLRDPAAVEIVPAADFDAAAYQQGIFGFAVRRRFFADRPAADDRGLAAGPGLAGRRGPAPRCLVLPLARALTGHGPAVSLFQAGPVLPGGTSPRAGS